MIAVVIAGIAELLHTALINPPNGCHEGSRFCFLW
jgi:hypothetical protein